MCILIYVCVYIYTHTHTHTHIHIYNGDSQTLQCIQIIWGAY